MTLCNTVIGSESNPPPFCTGSRWRGLLIVRALAGLIPQQWRHQATTWAVAAVVAGVALWMATLPPTPTVVGAAVGVGGLVLVWQLRDTVPPRLRWPAIGVCAALVVGCGTVAWVSWLADQDRRAPTGTTVTTTAGNTAVHACALTWTRWGQPPTTTAGPQPGHFTLTNPTSPHPAT